jgi:4-hydroxyproline epimerase
MVLLCAPADPDCAADVIFFNFNDVGFLGICRHGTIGVVATLSFMKRIDSGKHRMETPVGTVGALRHRDRAVTVNNVAS